MMQQQTVTLTPQQAASLFGTQVQTVAKASVCRKVVTIVAVTFIAVCGFLCL